MIVLYVVFHIACGVYDFGRSFAWLQNISPNAAKNRYVSDFIFCVIMAFLGPIAILASWRSGFYRPNYGFKWR